MRTVKPFVYILVLQFLLILTSSSTAQPWDFIKETEGIRVYTRTEPGHSFDSFKGETYLRTDVSRLAHLLGNAENFDWWDDAINEIDVLEYQKEKYILYYLVYDVPWPLSDRDLCVESFISQDPVTGSRTIYAKSLPNVVPEKPGIVRITDYWQKWTAVPQANGTVHLVLEGYADPAGYIPSWLYNMVITDTPINVIRKVRDLSK